nr:hypothetical protein [Tanacetum cinerariifolium]
KTLIEGTDMVAVVPEYVACTMIGQGGLRMDPMPIVVPELELSLSWSATLDNDPGERWLRNRVAHHLSESVSQTAAPVHYQYGMHLDIAHVVKTTPVADVCGRRPLLFPIRHILSSAGVEGEYGRSTGGIHPGNACTPGQPQPRGQDAQLKMRPSDGFDLTTQAATSLIADNGGFTRAAEVLHVSQPTLSQQIRQLEDMLGVVLFDRTSRTVTPTDAGQAYIECARRVLVELAAGKRALHDVKDLSRGTLRLAMTPTFMAYL